LLSLPAKTALNVRPLPVFHPAEAAHFFLGRPSRELSSWLTTGHTNGLPKRKANPAQGVEGKNSSFRLNSLNAKSLILIAKPKKLA